ncbi:MAG TPA: hypothetical protein VJB38_16500 [Bacteroidota bacterium]|nr:hypothetical protein [Bacteroidota bacterium]
MKQDDRRSDNNCSDAQYLERVVGLSASDRREKNGRARKDKGSNRNRTGAVKKTGEKAQIFLDFFFLRQGCIGGKGDDPEDPDKNRHSQGEEANHTKVVLGCAFFRCLRIFYFVALLKSGSPWILRERNGKKQT